MDQKSTSIKPETGLLSKLKLPEDLKDLSIEQCTELCQEIRKLLIDTVLKTGGHLASNLGVVELTVALHRNFDSPRDRIVWDVGHQAYVHKILTGRAAQFQTLRQENGLSGFPKPTESVHDTFIVGHSSTAVSAAFGMAEAMRMKNLPYHAVAVVGDGAMTGGMFFEGMNNAGKTDSRLIVILNDNERSISKNVGALSKYLSKIRRKPAYVRAKWKVEKVLGKTPVIGEKLVKTLKRQKDRLRKNIEQTTFFEDMGFVYLGPVDGHNIEELDDALTVAKGYNRPVLLHVCTQKGRGYAPAEKNPGKYHGVSPKKPEPSGIPQIAIAAKNPEVSVGECFSNVFGKEICELAMRDKKICAVTAAMKYGTGLQFFASAHPERYYDVGIAEQHAVTFCTALASMRLLPVFAVYSTFLQRAYDQLMHDAAISGAHVVIGVDRAGMVGEDGETHQGIFDVPMLTSIPGCKVYSPASYEELRRCIRAALYSDKGLTAVRYPRGKEPEDVKFTPHTDYAYEKGKDVLLITYGVLSAQARRAMEALKKKRISCGLLRLVTISPIPQEAIDTAAEYSRILFFEEGSEAGGIAEKLAMKLLTRGWSGKYSVHAAQGFVPQATAPRCLAYCGLTAEDMVKSVTEMLEKHD